MSLSESADVDGSALQLLCLRGRRHHYRAPAISPRTAVQQTQRLGNPTGVLMVFQSYGFAVHLGVGIHARMLPASHRNCSKLLAGGAKVVHVPAGHLR